MLPINLISVLVAGVAAFIVGFLIHGPIAGKLWMKLANIHPTGNEKLKDMVPQMIKNLFANFLAAYVLAMFIYPIASYYNTLGSVAGGMGIAFWAWLGFTATATSMDVIWMGKSRKLWMFDVLSSLLVTMTMGAILAYWMV